MGNFIQSGNLRIRVIPSGESRYLLFELQQDQAVWRTVLASGLIAPPDIWSTETTFLSEDPQVEWREGDELHQAAAFFQDVAVESQNKMTLRGAAGCHQVAETIEIAGPEHIHVQVSDTVASTGIQLGQLMTHMYFVPDQKVSRAFEPLDFAWLPALHKQKEHVCADHFFRSPAAIVSADHLYAALVPDLDLFARSRSMPHALDLRTTETLLEAPRLSYGICPTKQTGHVYFSHTEDVTVTLTDTQICYGFDLFLGFAEESTLIAQKITHYLWERYGHNFFQDVRPQVLPFGEYGRQYTYAYELPRSIRKTTINGRYCVGINNASRRGANFHAWENDLHVGYGIRYYADRWDRPDLRQTADGILTLALNAPLREGAFPCIYNFKQSGYEGTLYWTARTADPFQGFDSAAMSVSAWWLLSWYEDLEKNPAIFQQVLSYSDFLKNQQLPSGAIPTYYFSDLRPAKQLLESATTAICGAVLAKAAAMSGRQDLKEAAILAGRYVQENIVPGLNFNDFEAYYSCSPKPLHAIDYWTGIRPHCNLSLQWACDQFLALCQLTGEKAWLRRGEYLLSILSLYQQAWNPSHFSEYLFGGFGVMNTDGEWNDGRQARFASTYADYYLATGQIEYLERAIAACRASFALMDIPENHANQINSIIMERNAAYDHEPEHMQPGLGYAPENCHHEQGSNRMSWTGMNWSAGGALAASAYLDQRFGAAWVDCTAQAIVSVDGLAAHLISWQDQRIEMTITSALATLPYPYLPRRKVLVKFGRLVDREQSWTLNINGNIQHPLNSDDLERGILVQV